MRSGTTARVVATALTVLVSALPAASLASPASADGPLDTEVAVYLSATPGSDAFGVYRRPTAGGPAVRLVAPAPGVDRFDLAVARDGSRYAYAETVSSGPGRPVTRERVVVRDVAGPFKRVVLDRAHVDGQGIGDVALSPDGRTVAWTLASFPADGDDPTFVLVRSSVFGAPAVVAGSSGLVEPVFLSRSALLAFDARSPAGALRTIPVAGGATRVVGTGFGSISDLRVSPAGDRVAYQDYSGDQSASTVVAPLAATGAVDRTQAVTVTSGTLDRSAGWRRDGASLLLTRAVGEESPGDLWTVPVGAPGTAALVTTPDDETEVVVGRIDATAPGAIGSGVASLLAGTAATLPLDVLPADADWSGTYYRRSGAGPTVTRLAPVGLRVVDTGLVVGQTYDYAFAAVDSSGNLGPWSVVRRLTATAPPSFTTSDPTSTTATRASFPVVLSAVNAPSTRYDVLVGRNGGAYAPWVARQPGNTRLFGARAGTGVQPTISFPGSTYRFSGVAFDAFGNRTASIGTRAHAVVPLDDGAIGRLGRARTVARPGAYGGTTLFLQAAGAQAGVRLVGDRLQVIGERGPTTGRFDVYDNDVKVATVDTLASRRQVRQVLHTRTLSTGGSHVIVVRAHGTPGRPTVVLDGLGVRRS